MTPENKAKYFKGIFNDDINACIRLCSRLISGCLNPKDAEYYREVKQILETNK